MKKTFRLCALLLSVVMLLGTLCGCSYEAMLLASNNTEQSAKDLVGEWIDLENDTVTFNADGSCNYYYGEFYESYDFDGKTLTLVSDGTEYTLDARLYGENFVFYFDYQTYMYERTSGNTGELAGDWATIDGSGYTFNFTDTTFVEDGEKSGNYYIEEDEILFAYDDGQTIMFGYFELDGDVLTVHFGYPLTPVAD